MDRETLGKIVRDAWVNWAQQQPDPQPGWLDTWDELSEEYKEVDRQIGDAVAHYVLTVLQTDTIIEVHPDLSATIVDAIPESAEAVDAPEEASPTPLPDEVATLEALQATIQRSFASYGVQVQPVDSIYLMIGDGVRAVLVSSGDRIIGKLKEFERRLGCYYSNEPADRVAALVSDYETIAARATQRLADFRSDVLTYLRAISLLTESVASAGTHKEKDATLRAVLRLLESSITKVRDESGRFGSDWRNPDIFASDYPVMKYIEQIRKLEAENKKLKGEPDTPLPAKSPLDEITF